MDYFAGRLRGKQNDHGDHARSQQDQHECSEELSNQLRYQRKPGIHQTLLAVT